MIHVTKLFQYPYYHNYHMQKRSQERGGDPEEGRELLLGEIGKMREVRSGLDRAWLDWRRSWPSRG